MFDETGKCQSKCRVTVTDGCLRAESSRLKRGFLCSLSPHAELELSAFCSSVITQRFLLSRTEACFRFLVAFVHGDRHKPQMSHQ